MTLRAEITVLLPVLRMAPIASVLAWLQAGLEKRGAKAHRTTRTSCGTPNMSNLLMVDYVSPPLARITRFVSSKMPQHFTVKLILIEFL
jgi:hypothetical protein